MAFARNFTRLLRGEGITSHSGELLGYANYFTSIVIGLAVAIAARSVGWGLFALAFSFFGLFAMLADRNTLWLAAVIATGTVALALGAVGWLVGGGFGAVLVGDATGGATAAVYAAIARRLSTLGEDWY